MSKHHNARNPNSAVIKEVNKALVEAKVKENANVMPLNNFLFEELKKSLANTQKPFVAILYSNQEEVFTNALIPNSRHKDDFEQFVGRLVNHIFWTMNRLGDGEQGYLFISAFDHPGNIDLNDKSNVIDRMIANPATVYIELTENGSITKTNSRTNKSMRVMFVDVQTFNVASEENLEFVLSLKDDYQAPVKQEPIEGPADIIHHNGDEVVMPDNKEEGNTLVVPETIFPKTVGGVTTHVSEILTTNSGESTAVSEYAEYLAGLKARIIEVNRTVHSDDVKGATLSGKGFKYTTEHNEFLIITEDFTTGDSNEKLGTNVLDDVVKFMCSIETFEGKTVPTINFLSGTKEPELLSYIKDKYGIDMK